MGYRETKKRSLRTSHISSGTSDYPSFLSFFVKFASFLQLTPTSLRAFPPLVFLTSRLFKIMFSQLDRSFSRLKHPWIWLISRSITFGFWKLNFRNVLLSYPLFFASGNTLPSAAIKIFSSLLKLVVRPDVETMLVTTSNWELITPSGNAFPFETLFSHWLEKTGLCHVLITHFKNGLTVVYRDNV